MKLMQSETSDIFDCDVTQFKSQDSVQLSKLSILRIILSLIVAEAHDQSMRQEKAGAVTPIRYSLKSVFEGVNRGEFDQTLSVEGELGLDSLTRLSVISRLASFFSLGETGIDDYLLLEDSLGGWVELISYHQSLCALEPTFTFQTLGTTGTPKLVKHKVSKLLLEVGALLSEVDIGTRMRVISLVPPHHMFGFIFSILLPERAGIRVLDLSSSGPSAAARHANGSDLIIGTTFNWKRLLTSGVGFSYGTVGITSGGRADSKLWSAAKDSGLKRLVDVYGSTETGGVAWRDDAHKDFRLLPYFFREEEYIKDAHDAKIDLQDNLIWFDERRFQVSDRVDLCKKVGGVNVSLDYVKKVLLSSGLFDEIFIRASDERIKAFAVVSSSVEEIEKLNAKAIDFCNKNLEAPARPQQFTFGSLAPRNGMGKIQDW